MLLANKSRDALNVPSRETIVSEALPFHFDYASLKNRELEKWLKNCTKEIKSRNCKVILQLAQIGNLLLQAKEKLPGKYIEWLNAEFIVTGFFEKSTAENYIKVKKAVDEYGIEKLANFSMISIYSLFSNRVDKEFKDFIIEEVAPSYHTITGTYVDKSKRKYKLLKNTDIPFEDTKPLLSPEVSEKVVEQILGLPKEEQTEHLERLKKQSVATNPTNLSEVTINIGDEVNGNRCVYYKPIKELLTDTYNFGLLQHSLFRESSVSTELNTKINQLLQVTSNLIILIDPIDLYNYKLELPPTYRLKHIVFCRREASRLLSDIDVNNILMSVAFITNRSNSRTLIDDYHLDYHSAIVSLLLGYSFKGDDIDSIILSHTNSNIQQNSLYNTSFTDKLHTRIKNIFIENV